jgi:hypothetical protein
LRRPGGRKVHPIRSPAEAAGGENVRMEDTVFEAAGGSQGLLDLAWAWHRRCLADPVVSHACSHPGIRST